MTGSYPNSSPIYPSTHIINYNCTVNLLVLIYLKKIYLVLVSLQQLVHPNCLQVVFFFYYLFDLSSLNNNNLHIDNIYK